MLEQARIEEENKNFQFTTNQCIEDCKSEVPDVERDNINRLKKKPGQKTVEWYKRYYRQAKSVFNLQQEHMDLCMGKVEEMIQAKANGAQLSGKREAYAAVLLDIVADDQNLPI